MNPASRQPGAPQPGHGPVVVAIGAGTGGLEALHALLPVLGAGSSLAIVVVQPHPSLARPWHPSESTVEAAAGRVIPLENHQRLVAGAVYLAPAGQALTIHEGRAQFADTDVDPAGVIDHFFASVAKSFGNRSFGILLSGTGRDGRLGLQTIADRGGLAVAQNEQPAPKAAASPDTDDDLNAYRQRVVAAGFTPRSLIIDESDHILNASPDLQDYFGFTSGDHRTDVVQMAHPDLRHGLSLAIQDARRGRCRIQRDNLTIRDATTVRGVMVTVEPLPALGDSAEPYLVVLQELGLPKPRIEQATAESRTNQSESQALVSTLESELETTRREFGRSLEAARMDAVNVDLKNSKVQRQGALSRYLGIPSRGTLEAYFGRVHPDDLEGLKSAMNSPSVQEPIYSAVYRFRRGNRGWVWLEDEAEVTFDEQGQPIRLTGVCRDVSVQREAQLAQLSRERQIRTIIDAIPALVAYLDSDLRYQFANREYRAQFDPDAGDIVGQSASEVLTPEAFALAEPKLAAALEGKSQCYELELPDPVSGAPSFKEVNYLPDFNAKGDIAGCFVMATDVTERRLAAQIVESRERELSSLISSTAEGIYGIDLEGVCTFANEACIRLLGFEDVSQLVGRQMHELIHHHLNDGRRYDNEDCAIYRALRKGREVHVDDEVFWRADGSQLEVEYWSYPQVVDGQVVGCVVTFLDSTERRSWERELEEREGHLRRVIDNMLGLVGVLTPDGTLVEVNEAALRIGALAREDVIGRPFWDCYWWNYDDVSVARLRGWVERALNGELIREDVPVRIVDGELMEIDFQLVPVHDADGKVEYLVPSGLDISDRKRTEELAAARERQLNLALEAGKMGAFEWDLMHGRVAWSDHLYRIMAQPVEEFDGRLATVQALIAPEDQDRIAKRLANQWQSDSLDHDAEYRVVGPNDDQMIWLHERGSIQRDRSGRAVAVLGIVSDITERKRRELGLAFLADLQVDMVGATSIDELLRATGSRLATHMSLSRCAIFEFDDASPLPQLIHEHRSDRRVSRIGSGPLETLHSRSEWKLLAEGGVLVVSETRSGSRSSTNRKRLEALRIGSFVHVVHSYRQHAGLSLLATKERGHTWLPDEITFLGQLVDQLQPRLERARAIATLHQSERRLRISEELLKVGTEVANLAILKIDYHRDQCELSAEAAELYGLGVSEMVVSRERSRETCHADDRAGLDAAFEGCLDPEGDGNCTHEHRVHWPNGEVRWIRVQKRVYFDRTQRPPKPTHAILAAQDITTRKHWEIELADREAHLRRVINNQLGLVGVIGTDGRLMEIDDDSLSIAGIQREDVIGKHFAECRWWTYDDDVATTMKRSMERAFAGELVRYDVPLYAQGNQTLMIDFMLAPVWDEDDRIEYLIYSGVDISERKRAERRLEESEQRLALALEAAGMGTFVWEAETGEAVCDPQHFALSGLDRGATKVGERFEERIHPDDLEAHKEAIRVALERGEKFENEFRYIRPDGEVRWLAGRGQFMKSEVGGSTRMVGLNWDITERKQFEDSLEEARRLAEAANRSKSEFVANMSHEIRTPMTAVLGYADLLAADETDKERKQYLRVIKRNGDFLLRLINDILDLSKIESGKLDVSTEAFIIQEVVEDVRAMMADRALGKQLDFQVEYELGVPEAVASDAKRLKQILVNLIGNAIKFTDVGGVKVVVRFIEGLPGQLQFDVIDTGIGVPEAHQERMFEPFSQGDASVSRRFGGTGLGLAISQRLARVLGGEITVSSEPGRGSTFRCTISAEVVSTDDSRLTSRQTPTRVTQQSELARHDGLRILVVDDRRDVRHLARHMLERSGATVTLACDGVEALAAVEAARQHDDVPFELILLDMQMPGLDGYETAQRLRSMGFEHPIIAFTADAMQGDMGRCLESGCDDYLSKPIDVGELFTLVTTYSQQLDLDRLIARRAQRRASDSRDQSMD